MQRVSIHIANIALLSFFTLILFSGPIVWVQFILLKQVVVGPIWIKACLAILLIFAGGFLLKYFSIKKQKQSLLVQFAVLIFYSFIVLMVLSVPNAGVFSSIQAYLYNYSLFLFVVPLLILVTKNDFQLENNHLLIIVFGFIGFILLSAILSILQFIFTDIWLSSITVYSHFPDARAFLVQYFPQVKFDQINGLYRSQGFFRSPVESGIVCILAFLISVEWMLLKKHYPWYAVVAATIIFIAILFTVSRTVYLMMLVSVASLLYFHANGKIVSQLFEFMKQNWRYSVAIVIFGFIFSDSVLKVFDPTNLLIRFQNWGLLLDPDGIDLSSLLFGMGRVQNGDFGSFHSLVIDNSYIALFYSSGLVGLLLWLAFIKNWIRYSSVNIFNVNFGSKVFISFVFGFLVGAITENLLHYLFYIAFAYVVVLAFQNYITRPSCMPFNSVQRSLRVGTRES